MKFIRRICLILALVLFCVSAILLLNFTAPNPTGRRYSSQIVLISGGTQSIGNSGEAVLSEDLHLPNNNASDQLQCLCNPTYRARVSECRTCVASSELVTTFRRPDFISPYFIAESKNVQILRDFEQISVYAAAARLMGRPLWVFVRVNTIFDSGTDELVKATGGGIVPYFAVPGYVDPVDTAAKRGLAASTVVLFVCGAWEIAAGRRRRSLLHHAPLRPAPKSPKPDGKLVKAIKSVENAEDFHNRTRDRFDG